MPPPKDPEKYKLYIQRQSESHKGQIVSEETRKKIGITSKGRIPTKETRIKISKSKQGENHHYYGKKLSLEHRKKMSESHKGQKNHFYGKHHTEEANEKNKLAHIGKLHPMSEEQKKKLSAMYTGRDCWWNKGKPRSEETKKKIGESNKGKCALEKSPFWKGGISYEPYCPKFNKEFKERARAWYGYTCVECGTPQHSLNYKLLVHHPHYDKKMCCNGSPEDVVVLCRSCHSKTNFNREYWEQHFTDMICGFYQGKSFFTKEEMKQWCI